MEVILEAAAQVFEARGYAGTTTNQISERAGVSIGTLYQYFPNKEALVVALLEAHLGQTLRKLRGWADHTAALHHDLYDALTDYVREILEVHRHQPRLQHILLEEAPLPPRLHDLILESEAEAVSTLADLLRRYPDVRHPRLDCAAYFMLHTVETLTHRFVAHPQPDALGPDHFAAELVAMLEAYLRGPGAR